MIPVMSDTSLLMYLPGLKHRASLFCTLGNTPKPKCDAWTTTMHSSVIFVLQFSKCGRPVVSESKKAKVFMFLMLRVLNTVKNRFLKNMTTKSFN